MKKYIGFIIGILLLVGCETKSSGEILTIEPTPSSTEIVEITPTSTVLTTSDVTPEQITYEKFNILVLGLDRELYADAIILVHIELSQPPVVKLVSIARELVVSVDGLLITKINNLVHDGYSPWDYTLYFSEVFDIELDGIVIVKMDGFIYAIDSTGKIELTPKNNVNDKCGDTFYIYTAGITYEMDGFELLCYARMRMYSPNGYFDRQERHMEVLQALADSLEYYDVLDLWKKEIVQSNIDFFVGFDMFDKLFYAYWASDQHYVLETYSMNTDILELYDRPNGTEPYMYKPTVDLKEWMQDILEE